MPQSASRIIALATMMALGLSASTIIAGKAMAEGPGRDADISLPELRQLVGLGDGTKPSNATYRGDDSCQWANDGECDDNGLGTGACRAGTDYSDCWRIAAGVEDNTCRWANDGECDEPRIGTGACSQGTDFADCAALIHLRFRTDSCTRAFDGVCNEPDIGDGACEARTDRADCIGRNRPGEIDDHFRGYDDRELFDTATSPWMAIGWIELADGGSCSATLVDESVIVTAAHCIELDKTIDAAGTFSAGFDRPEGPLSADIEAYLLSDRRNSASLESPPETDWALLRLNRPIGQELGFVAGATLKSAGADWRQFELIQAGYSWDTGDNLSGHFGCRLLSIRGDGAVEHDCDTTVGDSGSPIMVVVDGAYFIIATDSAFESISGGAPINVATSAEEWVPLVEGLAAGRIGTEVNPSSGQNIR